MIKDRIHETSKGKKITEILVDNLWIPAMATDLRIVDRNTDLIRVKEIRVRKIVTKRVNEHKSSTLKA